LFHFLWCFAFAFGAGILTLMWQDLVLIVGTALIGSFQIGAGLDQLFFKTGFATVIPGFLSYALSFQPGGTRPEYNNSVPFWIIFSIGIVVALLGALLQYRFTAALSPSSVISPDQPTEYDALPQIELAN